MKKTVQFLIAFFCTVLCITIAKSQSFVWKQTDTTKTGLFISDLLPFKGALIIAPAYASLVHEGLLFKTTNLGQSWDSIKVGEANGSNIGSLALDSTGILYAATLSYPSTTNGIYRSTDEGTTWTNTHPNLNDQEYNK